MEAEAHVGTGCAIGCHFVAMILADEPRIARNHETENVLVQTNERARQSAGGDLHDLALKMQMIEDAREPRPGRAGTRSDAMRGPGKPGRDAKRAW